MHFCRGWVELSENGLSNFLESWHNLIAGFCDQLCRKWSGPMTNPCMMFYFFVYVCWQCGQTEGGGLERVQFFIWAEGLKINGNLHYLVERTVWYKIFLSLLYTVWLCNLAVHMISRFRDLRLYHFKGCKSWCPEAQPRCDIKITCIRYLQIGHSTNKIK